MVVMPNTEQTKSTLKKLGWFVGIWAASVLALGVVSYGLKAIFGL